MSLHLLALCALLSCTGDPPEDVVLTPVFIGLPPDIGHTISVEYQQATRTSTLAETLRLSGRRNGALMLTFSTPNGWQATEKFPPGRHLIVLLPRKWPVEVGSFSELTIPLHALLGYPPLPTLLRQDPRMWRLSPVPVSVIRPETPVAEWEGFPERIRSAVDSVNEAAGFPVLRYQGLVREHRERNGAVVVRLGDDLGEALGVTASDNQGCTYHSDAGFSCAPRWIGSGKVYLRSSAGHGEIVHELLHSLGLQHTCVVPSAMATEFPEPDLRRCGAARSALGFTEPLVLERRFSAFDVVALQVLRRTAVAAGQWRGDSVHLIILD